MLANAVITRRDNKSRNGFPSFLTAALANDPEVYGIQNNCRELADPTLRHYLIDASVPRESPRVQECRTSVRFAVLYERCIVWERLPQGANTRLFLLLWLLESV